MEANLLGKIKSDLLSSLKAGDKFRADTLRFLLSVIHNAEIAKGKGETLTGEELAELLQKQVRRHRESIEAYKKGDRADLIEKEEKELEVIRTYLPKQLSDEEIEKLAKEAIKEVGASGPQDMGKVMGALMPKVKGKADGSAVSRVVKELLS